LDVALEDAGKSDPRNLTHYLDNVRIVLDIEQGSANRLDSVYIRPLVKAVLRLRRLTLVRKSQVEYSRNLHVGTADPRDVTCFFKRSKSEAI
jgi:hypothetical protein